MRRTWLVALAFACGCDTGGSAAGNSVDVGWELKYGQFVVDPTGEITTALEDLATVDCGAGDVSLVDVSLQLADLSFDPSVTPLQCGEDHLVLENVSPNDYIFRLEAKNADGQVNFFTQVIEAVEPGTNDYGLLPLVPLTGQLSLSWEFPGGAFDCAAAGVDTVVAILTTESLAEPVRRELPCEDITAVLEHVPAMAPEAWLDENVDVRRNGVLGFDYSIVVEGMDGDDVTHRSDARARRLGPGGDVNAAAFVLYPL